jgi:hypothetical protein
MYLKYFPNYITIHLFSIAREREELVFRRKITVNYNENE